MVNFASQLPPGFRLDDVALPASTPGAPSVLGAGSPLSAFAPATPAPLTPGGASALPPGFVLDQPDGLRQTVDEATRSKPFAFLPLARKPSGEVEFAVPGVIAGIPAAIGETAGVVNDILRGSIREPKDMTPQEVIALGALGPGPRVAGSLRKTLIPPPAAVGTLAADAERLGVTLPRAVDNPGTISRLATSITSSVPVGGTPTMKAAQTGLQQLEAAAERLKGSPSSLYEAGQAIEKGITEYASPKPILTESGDRVPSILSARVQAEYDKLDNLMTAKPVAGAVDDDLARLERAAAETLAAGTGRDVAATTTTGELTETRALLERANAEATNARLVDAQGRPRVSPVVKLIEDAATTPGGLDYAGIKALRSRVGEYLDNSPLAANAGIAEGDARAVYAALTQDMRAIIEKTGGPAALKQWEIANATAASAHKTTESLSKILRTGNEGEGALYDRMIGMAGSGSRADIDTLNLARNAVTDDGWVAVRSAMVERLGFDETGAFNPKKFATSWAKLTPEGKAALFRGPEDRAHLQALESLARLSRDVAPKLQNLAEPKEGAFFRGALGLGGVTAVGQVFAGGIPWYATIATGILGSRAVSNVLAKPRSAQAFNAWAHAYEAFRGNPSTTAASALGTAARGLAYYVAIEEGLDNKSQLYLGNYLQGAPIGQPLAPSEWAPKSAPPRPPQANPRNLAPNET